MKTIMLFFAVAVLASCAPKVGPNVDGDGFMAKGYDVTEYFNDRALEGNDAYTSTYNNAKYKFLNQENKDAFDANPDKFEPEYSGYCAYAVAANKKVGINPESYAIQDGKLYLFYGNTLEKWNDKGAEKLQKEADTNWTTLKGN